MPRVGARAPRARADTRHCDDRGGVSRTRSVPSGVARADGDKSLECVACRGFMLSLPRNDGFLAVMHYTRITIKTRTAGSSIDFHCSPNLGVKS